MTETVDCIYLAMKVINNSINYCLCQSSSLHIILILYLLQVILIFGICGALRCDEIKNMKVSDVEEIQGNKFLVSVCDNKNFYPG